MINLFKKSQSSKIKITTAFWNNYLKKYYNPECNFETLKKKLKKKRKKEIYTPLD